MMTLQWTLVAGILYTELSLLILLLLPFIPPRAWRRLFTSRFFSALGENYRVYTYSATFVLAILFLDAVREVREYSHVEQVLEKARSLNAEADVVNHMRLFRAQRNFYVTGVALILFLIVSLLVCETVNDPEETKRKETLERENKSLRELTDGLTKELAKLKKEDVKSKKST